MISQLNKENMKNHNTSNMDTPNYQLSPRQYAMLLFALFALDEGQGNEHLIHTLKPIFLEKEGDEDFWAKNWPDNEGASYTSKYYSHQCNILKEWEEELDTSYDTYNTYVDFVNDLENCEMYRHSLEEILLTIRKHYPNS